MQTHAFLLTDMHARKDLIEIETGQGIGKGYWTTEQISSKIKEYRVSLKTVETLKRI